MNKRCHKYLVAGTDLSELRSRTEEYVAECMREVLDDLNASDLDQESIRDIYAYTLNQLPALYLPQSVATPNNPARAWDIHAVVEKSIRYVQANPKQ